MQLTKYVLTYMQLTGIHCLSIGTKASMSLRISYFVHKQHAFKFYPLYTGILFKPKHIMWSQIYNVLYK